MRVGLKVGAYDHSAYILEGFKWILACARVCVCGGGGGRSETSGLMSVFDLSVSYSQLKLHSTVCENV